VGSSGQMCGCSELLEQPRWYAIQTRSLHEKKIDVRLREHSISTFLPWARQVHRWSDRRKLIELPLSRAMPLSISSRMLRHGWPFSELMG
jgi:hypothetical protein